MKNESKIIEGRRLYTPRTSRTQYEGVVAAKDVRIGDEIFTGTDCWNRVRGVKEWKESSIEIDITVLPEAPSCVIKHREEGVYIKCNKRA